MGWMNFKRFVVRNTWLFLIYFLILLHGRVKLCAPPTSTSVGHKSTEFYREGFVISLSLEDGSTGYGEVRLKFLWEGMTFDLLQYEISISCEYQL